MNRAINDFPVRRPSQTVIAVAVLVSGAQGAGFGLLARPGDLEGGENLVLEGQQRLPIRARPNSCVPRKVVRDLADFASLGRLFVKLQCCNGPGLPLRNARNDQVTASGKPGEI